MSLRGLIARLAILAAVGGLLPLGAGIWWGFELLAHFRLQYLVIALTLAAGALASGKRRAALLLAAVVGVNAWPLLPYLPLPREAESGVAIDVLNVNVNAGNRDHAGIVGAIASTASDLVAVTELTPALDRMLPTLAAAYPYRFTVPASSPFGIGILSRYPLIAPRSLTLVATQAIDSRIALPSGTLRFIAVHLMPPIGRDLAATRNRQLDELARLVSLIDEPLVVCGDFNLTPYSPLFARFERAARLRNVRRGFAPGFSWPSSMPLLGIPIDHCFVRGPIAVEAVERLERTGSDHYPVAIRLVWQGTA